MISDEADPPNACPSTTCTRSSSGRSRPFEPRSLTWNTVRPAGGRDRGPMSEQARTAEPGITDAAIERLRARIGIPEPHPHAAALPSSPNIDAFRNVAIAYGDDNPLWCDPDVRRGAPAGAGPIASPVLVGGDTLIGEDEVTEVAPEHRDLMKGDPLRGVHAFYSASAREWWAPLRPGHRVCRRNALVGVLDKPSEFAERAVHEWTGQVFRDDDGHAAVGPVPADDPHRARPRRGSARSTTRVELAPYTDEEIDEIDAQYARRRRRAAPSRAGGRTCAEGDTVGPMVKGPLTVTDIICWHIGMGMGLYGVKPLRLGCAEPPAHPPLLPPRRPEHPRRACSASTGIPSSPAGRATRPPSTTAACARPGSSTSAPTGWATTPGCGSSTASSGSSTTSATPSGCRAR